MILLATKRTPFSVIRLSAGSFYYGSNFPPSKIQHKSSENTNLNTLTLSLLSFVFDKAKGIGYYLSA